MTAYTDLHSAFMLRDELDRVTAALSMLNAGGTITSITISPALPVPAAPGAPATMPPLAATVSTSPGAAGATPVATTAITALVAWLNQRKTDLNTQLTALAVTAIPA